VDQKIPNLFFGFRAEAAAPIAMGRRACRTRGEGDSGRAARSRRRRIILFSTTTRKVE